MGDSNYSLKASIEAFNEDPSQFVGRTVSEREAYNIDITTCLTKLMARYKSSGMNYTTSGALYRVDQTAYRCGFNDYTSHLEEDKIYVEGITEPPKES
jgi:hypothetical protein